MAALVKKTLRELRSLVQVNDHGGAYQLAATALGFDDLAERLGSINLRHVKLGYLSHNLAEERRGLYNDLLTRAQATLNTSEYQQLYHSF